LSIPLPRSLFRYGSAFLIDDPPNAQEFAKAIVNGLTEVNDLEAGKGPGETLKPTTLIEQRYDPFLVPVVIESEHQLILYPSGLDRVWR
jgi:hypothetical protein